MKFDRTILVFVLATLFIRLFAWFFSSVPLYPDEAQYWIWSRELDFGYYSKPPLIAWLIRFATDLFGSDSERALRFIPLVLNICTGAVIYTLSRQLKMDKGQSFASAATFYTLASISLSSNIVSTDAPLMLCAALHLFFFARALESGKMPEWIMMGIVGALGLLTKYSYGLIFIGNAFYLLALHRTHLSRFCVAGIVSATLLAPNLYWNYAHDFVSIKHAAELTGLDFSARALFALKNIAKFFADQMAMCSPIYLLILLPIIIRRKALLTKQYDTFLLVHATVVLVVVFLASLLKHTHANWSALAYIPLSIYFASKAVELQKRYLVLANFSLQLACGILVMLYIVLNAHLDIPKKLDLYYKVKQTIDVASKLNDIRSEDANIIIAADDRKVYATLVYYTKPHLFDLKKYGEHGVVKDHFDLKHKLCHISEDTILASVQNSCPVSMKCQMIYKNDLLRLYQVTPKHSSAQQHHYSAHTTTQ